jgi:hypothetical protein
MNEQRAELIRRIHAEEGAHLMINRAEFHKGGSVTTDINQVLDIFLARSTLFGGSIPKVMILILF